MSSIVQICNRGLTTYLGVGTITAIDEGTPAAAQCDLHYDEIRQIVLEQHWWNWATKRAVLAELTNDRDEWEYKYAIPGDSIAIRWVNETYNQARALSASMPR